MPINPREIAIDNWVDKAAAEQLAPGLATQESAQQVTKEQEEELAKQSAQAVIPPQEETPPTLEEVPEKKVNPGLLAHQEATKLMKEFTGQQFCDVIRTVCYAAQGAGQSHSYGSMRTVGRTIDVDHFIEFSHSDHRAVINKHGKETIILYDETYPAIQVIKFLNEYVLGLNYFRI